ncbi:MAG: UDP-N-acetylmuramoyl-L-alanyl-D-glutamate--2,6-diaminopimelate ligase [Algicola sp.]|nr:UDP-N-acetylmuramoyl-L-alanyl-D-glutamate--2,6-diaminopimelate ligase [Algicola sp.]
MTDLQTWLSPFGIDAPAIKVKDVKADSREVTPGDVFVATKGVNQNGEIFIDSAIANGASAVLVDSAAAGVVESAAAGVVQSAAAGVVQSDQEGRTNVIGVENLSDVLPKLLAAFYRGSNRIKKIGITGTNGKTTISQLIAQLGDQVKQQVSVIGTLGVGRLDNLVDINNTTPGLANNYRLLDQFALDGSVFVAMEVSSQGLAQGRVSGIAFDCTVFTNLTQDHLDYHGTLEHYAQAKKDLFDSNSSATTVVNIDDATGLQWFEQWQDDRNVIAVGAYDEKFSELFTAKKNVKHVMFDEVQYTPQGLAFTLRSSWGQAVVYCPLFGHFNLTNLVSAMAVLLSFDVKLADLVGAVKQIRAVPGRMEQFAADPLSTGQVIAVVDYAHSPDALGQALQALKWHVKGQLWCIFGCGGDRDKSKRPLMAKMAELHADNIVITNDNPRYEAPEQIIDDIKAGLSNPDGVSIELDRKQAIATTLMKAKAGDIVLIAGKGHETYQHFGDEVIDYDERAFVRECCLSLHTHALATHALEKNSNKNSTMSEETAS